MSNPFHGLAQSFQAAFLASSLSLLGSCTLDRSGLLSPRDAGTDTGEGGMGGDGGIQNDGGHGGEGGSIGDGGHGGDSSLPLALGPEPTLPVDLSVLAPGQAHLAWREGEVPAGRTVIGYEVCSTLGPMADIDEATECPNPVGTFRRRHLTSPLTNGQSIFWKARTQFDDGSSSLYSAVRQFMVGASPVGQWPMNGSAMDAIGSNNGSLQNGPGFVAGISGQAVQLNGVSQYVDVGSGLNLAGPLTLSVWVYANAVATSPDTGIINKGNLHYALTYHTNGRVYFYINSGSNNLNAVLTPMAWHQVVGTFDGTTAAGGMRLYVDGVEVGTRASGSATTGATGNLWFGRYSGSYLNGNIDGLTVYGETLTADGVRNEFCVVHALTGADPLPAACDP